MLNIIRYKREYIIETKEISIKSIFRDTVFSLSIGATVYVYCNGSCCGQKILLFFFYFKFKIGLV